MAKRRNDLAPIGEAGPLRQMNMAQIGAELGLNSEQTKFLVQYVVCAAGVRPMRSGTIRVISERHMEELGIAAARLKAGAANFANPTELMA